MIHERRRITYALLLSLLIHTSLLSLTFRGQGLWPLWLAFPWQDRWIEAPDLRVTLVRVPSTAPEPGVAPIAEPSPQATVEKPLASGPTLTPYVSRAPAAVRLAPAPVSEANPTLEADSSTAAATRAATAEASLRADRSRNTAPPANPAPAVIALERIDEPTWVMPATPAMLAPVIAAAPSASIPETAVSTLPDVGDAARARIDQEVSEGAVKLGKLNPSKPEEQEQSDQLEAARQDAARQTAARAENARLEAERQEAARQAAALREAARKEAARQEAARQEAARREAARQESAREEAARQEEAAQQEAVRQEAARQEAGRQEARQEAARQEAARQETARQEAARQETARQEAARNEAARREAERQEAARVEAREAEARREERLRAIGRQLDEEAAQREATASGGTSRSLPPPWSLRRYRLFGRTDPNEEIILYAEAWERKIQLNTTLDMVLEAAKQPHTDPIVKVAIRSDGSVESVTFVLSSGVPALDDAIRRIVDSQKPYRVFPPSLASQYDVIEIRRTWYFGAAIRFY
jgi:TolA protein